MDEHLQPGLYNGDCLDVMLHIEGESVDLILCDLPYGTTRNKWDSVIPLEPLWEQYARIVKKNGAIALFAQPPFSFKLASAATVPFKYCWYWSKGNATGFLNAKFAPLKVIEQILVFSFGAASPAHGTAMKYNPQCWYGDPYRKAKRGSRSKNYGKFLDGVAESTDGRRYPLDLIEFPKDQGEDQVHSTQKPVKLLEYLIRMYTDEGDLVLDNCFGSCSTGAACYNTGRRFIGIEKDPEIFKSGKERYERDTAQINIFNQ